MSNSRLQDRYPSIAEFELLLQDATWNAGTDKADVFVKEIKKKYDMYGGSMFWSDAQDEWLLALAEGD